MSMMASQITDVSIVYSTVCSGADQRKHQSSALLAFVRGIHRWPVNSPHKGPVTRKMFPFDDVFRKHYRYISSSAWFTYPTKHYFVIEMGTNVHMSCIVVYCGIFVWCIVRIRTDHILCVNDIFMCKRCIEIWVLLTPFERNTFPMNIP